MRFKSDNRIAFAALLAAGTAALAVPAQAAVINYVSNGDFEQTTLAGSGRITSEVAGWSTTGYSFVFFPGTADTTGAVNPGNPPLTLWGPGTGSNNGLTATSPSGGNFIAADGDPAVQTSPISQTITGLTAGQTYTLSFEYAAAEQSGFPAASSQDWNVTLGSDSFTTPTLSIPGEGFSGWQTATTTFTASAASEVLSFLAQSTPSGVPPFVLLDGVSLTGSTSSVPEPSTWALVAVGCAVTAFGVSRRRGNAQPG